nr:DUF1963 domain-containing protein [Vibrio sp. Of7-15]
MAPKAHVPPILKTYEKELKNLQRDYISIKAKPLANKLSEDPLKLTKSKFLGFPFIPSGSEYPKDENGKPMILIAQINFSETPELTHFPSSGLLQLYFPADDWGDIGSEKILYHSSTDLQKQPVSDFSFIDYAVYKELPINKIHNLSFKKAIDTGCSEDSQFSLMFGTKDFGDFESDLHKNQKKEFYNYFSCSGHKIGGYATFTQGDPRDYSSKRKNDVQLLQIGIDDFIMFGDSGVGHLFIHPDDLKAGNLEKAYFYWDCC